MSGKLNKVYIIDTNYPSDYYNDCADGLIAREILKALRVKVDLRLALSREYFERAMERALNQDCEALHISCHGNDDGIALTGYESNNDRKSGLLWKDFAALFEKHARSPKALVMSACCGAASGIGAAFTNVRQRPEIIIGSTDRRRPADYLAAWALLYRRFEKSGIERDVAKTALEEIRAVVAQSFRYLRWDEKSKRYLSYPGAGMTFKVVEVV